MAKKQKKLSGIEKTKHKMRLEKEHTAKGQKEALGLTQETKGLKKLIGLSGLFWIKLVLLALFPLAFFMYSPLLFPVCLAYAGTFFIAWNLEKKANAGVKKDSRIKIPKLDAIFAIALIGFTMLCGLIVGATGETGMFEDKTNEQIRSEFSANRVDAAEIIEASGLTLSGAKKNTIQTFSMFTGYRTYFVPQYTSLFGFGNQVAFQPGSDSENKYSGTLIVRRDNGSELTRITVTRATGLPHLKGFNLFLLVFNTVILAAICGF